MKNAALRRTTLRVASLLRRLRQHLLTFDPVAADRKEQIVRTIAGMPIDRPVDLVQWHDLLCFLRAYPDSRRILQLADHELGGIHGRVVRLLKRMPNQTAKTLADTGIAGSTVTGIFSYDLTRFLAGRYPDELEIDWEQYDANESDPIWNMLPLFANWHEVDTFDTTQELTSHTWLQQSAGNGSGPLAALLRLMQQRHVPEPVARHLFEAAELPIRWQLTEGSPSRGRKRVRQSERFWQQEPLRGRSGSLSESMTLPIPPLLAQQGAVARQYCDDIKEVLGVRLRELYSLTAASEREVYTHDPGRGIRFVIYGNKLAARLPLESNFGAMIVRNGLPIGYGVSAMLFDRAEIAINIFPAFRAGESPYIIERFFSLFYQQFGARVLVVRSYQVGDDNDEALESGSFWFYYKLGFRPVNRDVARLAAREADKIGRRPGYRSPIPMLKKLAVSDMLLSMRPQTGRFADLLLEQLGLTVTRLIARDFAGDRAAAEAQTFDLLRSLLPIRTLRAWSDSELAAAQHLSPLLVQLPGLRAWSASDKAALVQVMRAKGGDSERSFLLLTQQHPKLAAALQQLGRAQR